MRRSFFGGLRRRVGLRRRGWGCCRGVGPPATVRGSAGGVEPPAEVWGSAAGWTWCLPPRKPLFFRRQAPRLWGRAGRPPVGRGASLPASPCSFVDRHHVFRTERADRRPRIQKVMHEPLFSAALHHIPSLLPGHFILISPAAAEKVMQEPHFGTFLHHFSPIPGKRPELEVRAPPEAEPSRSIHPACGGSCIHGRTEFGPRSNGKRSTKGTAALRASLPIIRIPERKELTTNTPSSPFRRQF